MSLSLCLSILNFSKSFYQSNFFDKKNYSCFILVVVVVFFTTSCDNNNNNNGQINNDNHQWDYYGNKKNDKQRKKNFSQSVCMYVDGNAASEVNSSLMTFFRLKKITILQA